jgi:hypothetical protein
MVQVWEGAVELGGELYNRRVIPLGYPVLPFCTVFFFSRNQTLSGGCLGLEFHQGYTDMLTGQ